jgi:2-polyprenyl-3-methyl-5-hydroxy-6-metoxy-1,4-benzoquinol methylase
VSATLETTPCPLCGGSTADAALTGGDLRRGVPGRFEVVRCRSCGHAYVAPRPTRATIRAFYPPDYSCHGLPPAPRVERWYYRGFRALPLPAGARVLDVGCGGGRYLAHLRAQGFAAEGSEVDATLAETLAREHGFVVHRGELPELPLEAGAYDAVTLWWVLEHTHDPLATLRAAARLLRPDGLLVVSVQNFESLGRRLFGRYWHHLDLPGHLQQFSPSTLARALAASGFERVHIRHDLLAKDFAPSLGLALGAATSFDRTLPNLLALPFDALGWLLRRSGLITAYARRRAA